MIGALPNPCHPEARVLCEPEDLCNLPDASLLHASCMGPSARQKRGPQDEKKSGSELAGLLA